MALTILSTASEYFRKKKKKRNIMQQFYSSVKTLSLELTWTGSSSTVADEFPVISEFGKLPVAKMPRLAKTCHFLCSF